MNIISLYPNFSNKGGAQNVLLSIAEFLNQDDELPLVLTDTPIVKIEGSYCSRACFKKFSIIQVLKLSRKNTIFISHDRKYSTYLLFLKKVFHLRCQILHIAHSIFNSKKKLTLLPPNIIAVSQTVKNNLVEYFKIPEKNISVIYNGIKDIEPYYEETKTKEDKIRIILLGRIEKVKQQLEIVNNLKGRLNDNIEIAFAGSGSEEVQLRETINNDPHFKLLGQVDVKITLPKYDYVLLFSEKEGLPLSLIEGCMFSKPLITNKIPSALEINKDRVNGYVFASFNDLATGINNLASRNSEEYDRMSKASREIYMNHFLERAMLDRYKEIIEKLSHNGR